MGSNSVVNKADNVHESNNEALYRNYSFSGKAQSITYSECVSVALVNQHANRMRRIILSYGSTMFFHIFS
jgi:hypothetical protein